MIEGTVKHIYFVAETKGTMESLNLQNYYSLIVILKILQQIKLKILLELIQEQLIETSQSYIEQHI